MYLSILKTDMPETKALLESYVDVFDCSNLSQGRLFQATRRACALALARDLLVRNNFLSMADAKFAIIEHFASGEPYLKIPGENKRPLHISISHSGSWIACILSHADMPAGIDLEDLSLKRNFLKVAEHYFSVCEFEYVKEHGPEAFYKLWTAKEAIAKLQGKGLSEVLKIQFLPSCLDTNVVHLDGCDYQLTCHMTPDYIYTIAKR